MKFDDLIVNYLGEFGTYQKLQFFLVCLPTIFTAMHALSWTFTATNVHHRCRLLTESPDASYWLDTNNMSSLIKPSTNCNFDSKTERHLCVYEQCRYGDEKACPNGYVFDRSEVAFSAIDRWEIVCDRNILKAIIQSMYYVGQMIGSLVFGFLGDRFGRKKAFFFALILQIISGSLMFVAPHWVFFAILRLVVGGAHPGIFIIAVVIGMELAGPSKRKLASVMTGIFFSFGQVSLGLLAYFIRDYRYLQAAISLPTVLFISYLWIIPESARWLISQKRFEEANVVLQHAARINKTQLPSKWWEDEEISGASNTDEKMAGEKSSLSLKLSFNNRRKHNFLDLFRTPKIRKISFAIFFCWPIVSMIYYGLSMNPTFLGGNLYLNFIFGGLMEIPAVLFVYFVIDIIGRKPLLAAGFIIASVCALSNLFIGEDNSHMIVNIVQFLIAKCAITATYSTMYAFTPELFPTVIRNTAMGACSMIARFGAILASFISMWLVEIFGKAIMIIPFSVFGFLAAIVLYVFLPETNGRDLFETIEELEGETNSKFYELQPLQQTQALTKPTLPDEKNR